MTVILLFFRCPLHVKMINSKSRSVVQPLFYLMVANVRNKLLNYYTLSASFIINILWLWTQKLFAKTLYLQITKNNTNLSKWAWCKVVILAPHTRSSDAKRQTTDRRHVISRSLQGWLIPLVPGLMKRSPTLPEPIKHFK